MKGNYASLTRCQQIKIPEQQFENSVAKWHGKEFTSVSIFFTGQQYDSLPTVWSWHGIVCKVRTQDPENFHEEVKSLATAW